MTPQEQERQAIVAWLRDPERTKLVPMPDKIVPAGWERDDYGNKLYWREEQRMPMSRLRNATDLADAIERGDHLPTPTTKDT